LDPFAETRDGFPASERFAGRTQIARAVPVDNQSHRGRVDRTVYHIAETANSRWTPNAHRQIKNPFSDLRHAFHQASAACKNDARIQRTSKTHSFNFLSHNPEQFFGAWLDDFAEQYAILVHGFASTHAGHFD